MPVKACVLGVKVRLVVSVCCFSSRSRHEALQKLAIFFQHSKDEFADVPNGKGATPTKYRRLLIVTQQCCSFRCFFPLN